MNNMLRTKTAIPDQPAEVVHEVCYALRCSDFPRSIGHFVTMLHKQKIYTHNSKVWHYRRLTIKSDLQATELERSNWYI